MASGKRQTTSKTKKTGSTAKKPAAKKGAAAAKSASGAKEARRFWSYIMFFFGIAELLLTYVRGEGLWESMF